MLKSFFRVAKIPQYFIQNGSKALPKSLIPALSVMSFSKFALISLPLTSTIHLLEYYVPTTYYMPISYANFSSTNQTQEATSSSNVRKAVSKHYEYKIIEFFGSLRMHHPKLRLYFLFDKLGEINL